MAFAKPGPIRAKTALPKSTAPQPPEWLTVTQRAAWLELTESPFITTADEGLLYSYIRTLQLHEDAHASLKADGLLVTGYRNEARLNPAYRAYKETQATLLTLRAALMATPAARLKVAQTVTVTDDTDELETD